MIHAKECDKIILGGCATLTSSALRAQAGANCRRSFCMLIINQASEKEKRTKKLFGGDRLGGLVDLGGHRAVGICAGG